jgi:hypothetical protein
LIGAYKTTVSKQIHLIGLVDFKWQRSYHDRIVRNELECYRIMEYIIKNPENFLGFPEAPKRRSASFSKYPDFAQSLRFLQNPSKVTDVPVTPETIV